MTSSFISRISAEVSHILAEIYRNVLHANKNIIAKYASTGKGISRKMFYSNYRLCHCKPEWEMILIMQYELSFLAERNATKPA